MSSVRRENGFTLIEILLAMTLTLLLLGATLAVFATAERGHRDNQRQNEAQDQVRFATDTLARRLRNLASPTDTGATPQQALERAEPTDLIFRTVNSTGAVGPDNPQNLQRYRYCLGTDTNLYVERQTWSGTDPGMALTKKCPDETAWPETRVAASSITNGNGARPVFSYVRNPAGSFSEQTTVATGDFPSVVAIGTWLFVDPHPDSPPNESRLSTRVFLRNQNRVPSVAFPRPTIITGTQVQLNGTDSDDPEGARLSFAWYVDGVKLTNTSATPTVTLTAGTHSIYLVVTDVGNLSTTSITRTTTCTSSTCGSFTP
jgi:type II secretory pathway pseudopilin PulG